MVYILRSVSITAVISTLLSLLVDVIHPGFFIKYFIVFTVLQVIAAATIKTIKDRYNQIKLEKQLHDDLVKQSQEGMFLRCPCSRNIEQFTPLQLNQQNNYRCYECNRLIRANIKVDTILATEPVNLEEDVFKLNEIFDKLKNEQQES